MKVLLFCACPVEGAHKEMIASISALQWDGELEVLYGHDNPYGPGNYKNCIHQYQNAWAIIREDKSYDALFTVESDIIVPPDALAKLVKVDADIAYGVYMFRRGIPVLSVVYPDIKHKWHRLFGQVLKVDGLGFGCCLIRRSAIEVLDIYSMGDGGDGDSIVAKNAKDAGLIQKCDTSVICGHIRQKGTVLWPTRTGHREVQLSPHSPETR